MDEKPERGGFNIGKNVRGVTFIGGGAAGNRGSGFKIDSDAEVTLIDTVSVDNEKHGYEIAPSENKQDAPDSGKNRWQDKFIGKYSLAVLGGLTVLIVGILIKIYFHL
jgi:hypothetical protein